MTSSKNTMPLVAVVMGSKSDESLMQPAPSMLRISTGLTGGAG